MGQTSTPTYRVEYNDQHGRTQSMCWDYRKDGVPTIRNLEAWRDSYNKSFQPGGVNAHLTNAYIWDAHIIHQPTGITVIKFKAPMFEVV